MSVNFEAAAKRLEGIVTHTPLQYNRNLSQQYGCNVYLKREDMQIVRSYKIRGAYNMMSSLPQADLDKGMTTASAGNHAQGFAFSCQKLNIKGVVFMPAITPKQKVNQTKMFGGDNIEIRLIGDTFDDCAVAAQKYTKEYRMTYIPPFDDYRIIEGQGTLAMEILQDLSDIDMVVVPIGGGGCASGVSMYFKEHSPDTKIIGVEPAGAPSLMEALKHGAPYTIPHIDKFVDGAAVQRIGDIPFKECKKNLDEVVLVEEGAVCSTILKLYNKDAIVAEPAGALSIAALEIVKDRIKGKTVVCILSGGNNDIDRMPEIKERSLQYEGLKHYFLIRFAQRPGALRDFVSNVLGPDDDIARFEYMKKTNKEAGPALIGIELKNREDYASLIENMKEYKIDYTELNKDDTLFGYLV
ncbi:MAG: threonine ammonia-lyase IlvA [Chitinophagaceae bacterium]